MSQPEEVEMITVSLLDLDRVMNGFGLDDPTPDEIKSFQRLCDLMRKEHPDA